MVQYRDVRRSGTPGEQFSFQIRLNTANNVIKYIYQVNSVGTNANNPEIGIKGVNNSFSTNIKNITLACGANGWLSYTEGIANNSTMCFSPATFPASGTAFIFTPSSGPATPASISGITPQCAGATGQTYSVSTVTGASSYTWTVPTGWTITGGSGTNSITVTAGSAGQNGDITVTATNDCGTSAAAFLAVTANPSMPAKRTNW